MNFKVEIEDKLTNLTNIYKQQQVFMGGYNGERVNPSNAEAAFVQSTMTQRFLKNI